MAYTCRFYQDTDFDAIEQMVLEAYQWEHPGWNLSRHEFCRGLHPAFTGNHNAWRHTVGVLLEHDIPVACVINEGNYDGEQFFLFKNQAYAQDKHLLSEMIKFAKTYGAASTRTGAPAAPPFRFPHGTRHWPTCAAPTVSARRRTRTSTSSSPFQKNPFPWRCPPVTPLPTEPKPHPSSCPTATGIRLATVARERRASTARRPLQRCGP